MDTTTEQQAQTIKFESLVKKNLKKVALSL